VCPPLYSSYFIYTSPLTRPSAGSSCTAGILHKRMLILWAALASVWQYRYCPSGGIKVLHNTWYSLILASIAQCPTPRDVVSVSTSWSQDHLESSHLGLVADKVLDVSFSSRSWTCASRVVSVSAQRSQRLVSSLGPIRLVKTFHVGMPCITSVLQVCLSP